MTCVAAAVCSTVLSAQQPETASVLSGKVVSGGAALSGVEVAVQGLQWSVLTDTAGRFRLTGLPSGRQVIVLRRLGYAPRRDTLELAPGAETERTYSLDPVATQLDTVVTSADEVKYLSPRLRDFEDRRKRNVGGYFISEAELRQDEHVSVPSIMRRFPGLGLVLVRGSYYARTRGVGSVKGDPALKPGSPFVGCWASVWLDGSLIFDITMMQGVSGVLPPDLSQFFALDLAGVEYYSSAGSIPLKYKTVRSNCGAILFWTRAK